MEIGLLGLPRSGKSTLFHALTAGEHESGGEVHMAAVEIPDPRLDRLVEIYRPGRAVPVTVHVLDFAGVVAGAGKGLTPNLLARIGTCDAICAVLRAYDDGSGIAPDPAGDVENLILEMTISDLSKVENRLDRLRRHVHKISGAERQQTEAEVAVLERLHPPLEEGQPIRELGVTDVEEPLIRGFQFLSQKPLLVVLNIDEGTDAAALESALAPALSRQGVGHLTVNAEIEMEIALLDTADERAAFMADYGIAESARDRLVQRLHHLLGVITFFTVSEKEVHAWTVPAGTSALHAAGVIHSDMERGFIRAEVIHVDEFHVHGSSMAEARKAGKLRTEGKTYALQDGEILQVLFSV